MGRVCCSPAPTSYFVPGPGSITTNDKCAPIFTSAHTERIQLGRAWKIRHGRLKVKQVSCKYQLATRYKPLKLISMFEMLLIIICTVLSSALLLTCPCYRVTADLRSRECDTFVMVKCEGAAHSTYSQSHASLGFHPSVENILQISCAV